MAHRALHGSAVVNDTRTRCMSRETCESASEPRRRMANLVIFPATTGGQIKVRVNLRACTQAAHRALLALIRSVGLCRGKNAEETELLHSGGRSRGRPCGGVSRYLETSRTGRSKCLKIDGRGVVRRDRRITRNPGSIRIS